MDEKQRAAMRRSWRNKGRREEDECPICKGNFKKGDELFVCRGCQHTFHAECIHKWISRGGRNCPICREDITREPFRGTPTPRSSPGTPPTSPRRVNTMTPEQRKEMERVIGRRLSNAKAHKNLRQFKKFLKWGKEDIWLNKHELKQRNLIEIAYFPLHYEELVIQIGEDNGFHVGSVTSIIRKMIQLSKEYDELTYEEIYEILRLNIQNMFLF